MSKWVDLVHASRLATCAEHAACDAEKRAYAWLREEVASGLACPAAERKPSGSMLEGMLDELLAHPLAKSLRRRPLIYIHRDPEAFFMTFHEVIIAPAIELETSKLDLPHVRRMFKGVLAHELGHVLNADFRRAVENPAIGKTTHMERNADLLAAHLCQDGGRAMEERIAYRLRDRQAIPKTPHGKQIEERLREQERAFEGRYPSLEERIQYLRAWQQDFERGIPLPEPEVLKPEVVAGRLR